MACRFILKALSARPQLLAARLRSKSNVHSNSTEVPDPSGSPSFDTFPVVNFPVDKEESTEQGLLIPRIDLSHVGCASALGRLESNEDRLLACELSPFLRFFGIFDGHGGPQAADFALAVMPECVRYRLAELTNVYRKRGLSLRSIHPKYLEQVLENAFLEVNNLMSRHFLYYTTAHIRQSTGTTATVVLMRHSYQLVIGHVGDSRALICRKGRIEPLTVNHDPSTLVRLSDLIKGDEGDGITESDRIVASGGHVTTSSLGVPVVNGRLGMTRSLGDLPLKAFGVSAHPQLLSLKVRHSHDSFLVIVSDGVTHVMSDEEIFNIVASSKTPKEAAKSLVEDALLYGSDDNASALVIPFGSWGRYPGLDEKTIDPTRIAFRSY